MPVSLGRKTNDQNFLRGRNVESWCYGSAEIDTKLFEDAWLIGSESKSTTHNLGASLGVREKKLKRFNTGAGTIRINCMIRENKLTQ